MASVTSVVKFDGKIETFMGKPVSPALPYSGKVSQYAETEAGLAALKAANEFPKTREIVQSVNAKNKAKERAKVIAEVLKENGYEKPAADSAVSLFNSMVKTLKLAGRSDADAAKGAEIALGYNLAQAEERDAAAETEAETEDASA